MADKFYKFVDPDVTREQMTKVLVRVLNRKLTEQEIRIIYWLGNTEPETRGVLLDLFKELTNEIETLTSELDEAERIIRGSKK